MAACASADSYVWLIDIEYRRTESKPAVPNYFIFLTRVTNNDLRRHTGFNLVFYEFIGASSFRTYSLS